MSNLLEVGIQIPLLSEGLLWRLQSSLVCYLLSELYDTLDKGLKFLASCLQGAV